MEGKRRKNARCLALAVSAATVLPAHAMIPVFDIPNFIVNIGIKSQLLGIRRQLEDKQTEGTVNYNTLWIDKSTRSIDISTTSIKESTTSIDNSTKHIDESTTNIDNTTHSILNYNMWNFDIDTSFTWIINNNGGEIIPIPKLVEDKLKKITDWKKPDNFNNKFKATTEYGLLPEGGYSQATTNEGSVARKAANDALIQAIGSEQDAFGTELDALRLLGDKNRQVKGQAHQQQVANALAVSEVNQLMKLRSMMLVAEASRAVEAHVAADKEARQIAVGRHLRRDLQSAVGQSLTPKLKY